MYSVNSIDYKHNLSLDEVLKIENNFTDFYDESDIDLNAMNGESKLTITIIWSLLILTGTLGNGFVIFAILKSKKFDNVVQCYLLNLSITDLVFVLFCIPITTITYHQDHWVLGSFVCKFFHFASFATVCTTCLTLTMLTIDRYILICNVSIKRSPKCVFIISLCLWIVSMCLSTPYLIYCDVQNITSTSSNNQTDEFTYECIATSNTTIVWNHLSGWYPSIVSYIIPVILICFCYARIMVYISKSTRNLADDSNHNENILLQKQKKVGRKIMLFTLTFIVLWFPIHFLSIWYRLDENFPKVPKTFYSKLIAHTMTYANPTINPLIYAFSNDNFKRTISYIAPVCFKRKGLNNNNNINNTSNRVVYNKTHLSEMVTLMPNKSN